MKNKSYIFCFVAFIICFVSAYLIGDYITTYDDSDKKKYNEVDVNVLHKQDETKEYLAQTDSKIKVEGYWIKTENDYIVIYNSYDELVANTEICISEFSEKDKQILNEGVYVENAETLFRYLESYTS